MASIIRGLSFKIRRESSADVNPITTTEAPKLPKPPALKGKLP
jgi:hypothetical protein